MKQLFLKLAKFFAQILPEGTPEYIYTSLLKPKPLRFLANKCITLLLPPSLDISGNTLVALNPRDPVIAGALVLGVYEKFETLLFRQKLKRGGVVIDIGANVGYYTAIAASMVGEEGLVIAIEPDPESFYFLQKTLELNKFQNVKCFQLALSNVKGRGKLFLSKDNLGDHRIYPSPEQREAIEINFSTLDGLLEKENIKRVDFIKMDIQGAEGLAVQGMKRTLAQNPGVKMFTEFWPLGIERTGLLPVDYLRHISSFGFKIFNINRKNGDLEPVVDMDVFAKRFKGREFANLFCEH